MEIEHFRPKGETVTASGAILFPGYWWRASTWENLLPSCIDCNRERWHDTGVGAYKYGKQNQFPLAAGSVHASVEADVAAEVPLLLDPSAEEPANHLQFFLRKGLGGKDESIVAPLIDDYGNEDPKGRKSIDVYGLNRGGLRRSRDRQIIQLRLVLDMIGKDWLTAHREPDMQRRAAAEVELRRRIRLVVSVYLHWQAPFAAASRAYFRQWQASLQSELTPSEEALV
jgi:hypothetical protein